MWCWVLAAAGLLAAGALVTERVRSGERMTQARLPATSRRRVLDTVALAAAAVSLVGAATGGHLMSRQAGTVDRLAAQRATVRVEAVVTTDPRVVRAGLAGRQSLVIVKVSVRDITGRGTRSTPRTPVLVLGDERWLQTRWHQRVAFSGRLQPAEAGDDVEAVLMTRGAPRVIGDAGPLFDAVEVFRRDTRAATDGLPADARGLVPALVMGDTSRLPQDLNDDMRATGMTHLNAVSGSNVTLVLLSAMWLAGWLRIRGRWRYAVAAAVLGLFVMLCRPEPSVIRAAVMGLIGLVGMSVSRRTAGSPVLAAAVLVLLVYDPWLAASYGFALSTLATAGLLFFARPWADRIARRLPRWGKPLGEAIAIPMAAQAMCAPVIVLLQGSVSLIGIPANVLAAPLVAPATMCGVLTVLVAPVSTSWARAPAWLAALPTEGIAWVAHSCARVPLGTLPWLPGAAGALLLAGLTLIALFCGVWVVRHLWVRPYLAGAGAVLAAAAWAPTPAGGWPAAGWVYVACDVGQGDGGVLATSPGHALVVDTGPDPGLMDACLDRLGIGVVDAVVLTHYHADHVGGLAGVLDGRRVGPIYVTPVSGTTSSDSDGEASEEPLVRALAAQHRLELRPLVTGDVLDIGAVHALVVGPTRLIRAGSVQNNASVVLDVRSHGMRLLLTGDIESQAAAAVLGQLRALTDAPPVDVLKVPHHGSANQDPQLEKFVRAPIAVISVGAHNDYGHPSPRTLDLLRESNSTVERTDRGGDVAIVARDGTLLVARP
ncbi:ComEC/Rec2 family competence protein [Flexivirga caeni]|uniref:ComEC/Rec2 family competence protein n=2 Tax=Flexivirga caeni TaxID=2294115 RepID=A0A3M9M5A7_9MICO|nr:ComEC/Rec2 family competence protein [Flexivirga caeni]